MPPSTRSPTSRWKPARSCVSVSAGDTVRWVVGDTTSGEGKDAHVHILVKPIGADLDTNLVITTDRRTYHLELHSTDNDLHGVGVVDLSGRRADRAQEAAQRCRSVAAAVADTGVNIEQLRFRYRIEGDAPWKPQRVFDDGAKVYIQFPSGLAQSEAPPLFVIGPDGKPALVNYRVQAAPPTSSTACSLPPSCASARRRSGWCASSAPMPSGGRRSNDNAGP